MRFKLKSKSRIKINLINIIYCLHSIYGEIHDFNCNYWSKFLFFVWISLSSIINTLVFAVIFGDLGLINRIILIWGSVIFSSILLLVINTASSVHLESKHSYKLLNSCFFSFRPEIYNYLFQFKV